MDAVWILAVTVMSVAIAVLNAGAEHGFHTIEKHLVFRARILHGFATTDVIPSYPTPPTFPMWGYGWVLLLTTSKVALVGLQSRLFFQLSILFCTPWYAYHGVHGLGLLFPRRLETALSS